MPISPRQAIYAAIFAAIFFTGYKTSAWLWSVRYDALVIEHAKRIEEQRHRLLSRHKRLNEFTARREGTLLRELQITREEFENYQLEIGSAKLTTARPVVADTTGTTAEQINPALACGPVINWREFGRLYDSSAVTRPAATNSDANRGDATAAEPSAIGG